MRSIPPELAQSVLDAAPDALLVVDGAGVVQFANRQVSVLFGYAHDDIIGQPVEKLLPERFQLRHAGHRNRYLTAPHVRPMGLGLDLFAQGKNGTEFPISLSTSQIKDSEGETLSALAGSDWPR